jgi:hypothetical protein
MNSHASFERGAYTDEARAKAGQTVRSLPKYLPKTLHSRAIIFRHPHLLARLDDALKVPQHAQNSVESMVL